MNNIDIDIKDYIQDSVISPLERLMNGDNGEKEVNLYEKYHLQGGYPPKDSNYKNMLHEMMVPYYDMYLNGDYQLCKPNMEFIRLQMKRAIDDDDQFGKWASEQDLIISAEGWGDNLKRIPEDERIKKQYFYVLKALLQADCQQDWHRLSEELKEMLFKAEVYSDYKTDEVLCVLHAFTMIMQQEWTKEKKAENLEPLPTTRMKTYLILNAGMGTMTMADANPQSLNNLHGPILYLVGGSTDVAWQNAQVDYKAIKKVPVVLADNTKSGHGGTYEQPNGGANARMVRAWLDWQLKGKQENEKIFIDGDLTGYDNFTIQHKNYKK